MSTSAIYLFLNDFIYSLQHNAETEAVDLLMDVEDLDLLLEHVDKTNFKRTCNYLTSAARYFKHSQSYLFYFSSLFVI